MSYQEVLRQHVIAISISDSPDMAYLGLSEKHLLDAMAELARHLLALGARLCYGGDLRKGGFSDLLFELVQRHRRDVDDEDSAIGITNVLAWPVHLGMSFDTIERTIADLTGIAELVCLDGAGTRMLLEHRRQVPRREPTEEEWSVGLTSMRQSVQAATHARIVLGGRVENFKGSMPGIAEESLLSLTSGTPLFVLGGFGGCARDMAETMGFADPWAPLNRAWPSRQAFAQFDQASLKNGLDEEENRLLAKTPHIDQAIMLILKGLISIDT